MEPSCGGVCHSTRLIRYRSTGKRSKPYSARQPRSLRRLRNHLDHDAPNTLKHQVPGKLHTKLHGLVHSPCRPPEHAEVRLRLLSTNLYDKRICLLQVLGSCSLNHHQPHSLTTTSPYCANSRRGVIHDHRRGLLPGNPR